MHELKSRREDKKKGRKKMSKFVRVSKKDMIMVGMMLLIIVSGIFVLFEGYSEIYADSDCCLLEKACDDECCEEDEECIADNCCPSRRVCGDVCCEGNEYCDKIEIICKSCEDEEIEPPTPPNGCGPEGVVNPIVPNNPCSISGAGIGGWVGGPIGAVIGGLGSNCNFEECCDGHDCCFGGVGGSNGTGVDCGPPEDQCCRSHNECEDEFEGCLSQVCDNAWFGSQTQCDVWAAAYTGATDSSSGEGIHRDGQASACCAID